MIKNIIFFIFFITTYCGFGQSEINYDQNAKIGGIIIEGNENIDHKSIIKLSGLKNARIFCILSSEFFG